jgi:uncharacterized protein YyaL (SSP411 family)
MRSRSTAVFGSILVVFIISAVIFTRVDDLGKEVDMKSSEGSKHNRLFYEKSPYLLQHAHNPVDWYPWGDEAFSRAADEDKPIFLSVGYSACHWCQVMEAESFEDEEVAGLLNEHFVSVKVDREERPDVDNIYMAVCQSMTGSGGWPLTIVMTPERKPFFAGTYFPKEAKFGRQGLMQILPQIANLWENQREKLVEMGDQATKMIRKLSSSTQAGELSVKNLEEAFFLLQGRFDARYGGFGGAPKFPSGHTLSLLLRWWKRSGEEKALAMVEKTLDAMRRGGMHDHLGFGFHRYSTDAKWLVPHFEKMLYDQAMLAVAYVEAYQATGKTEYAETARQLFTYALRDMTSPDGGFYSAENADSEGEEGKFYVWTQDEIKKILGERQADVFLRFYGVTERGNFEGSRNVLHIDTRIEELAKKEGMTPEELREILDKSRGMMFAARKKRMHPSKDDKILTDWNGLMIAAMAKGAQALDRPDYAQVAGSAADFLLKNLRRSDGRLLHRYREGEAAIPGYLDDYAFLIWGLLELYQATFETRYLTEAVTLTDDMLKIFWDEKEGGFFFTGDDAEKVLARTKEVYDGAIPSGNSVALLDLLRLGRMTAKEELEEKAAALMRSFGGQITRSPTGFTQFLIGVDFALGPTKEIVIAGQLDGEDTRRMLRAIGQRFLPRQVLILHPGDEKREAIEQLASFVKEQYSIDGKATAYVCENYACELPTTNVDEMISRIESD